MAGRISAIGAIIFGLLFAALAIAQLRWELGVRPLVPALAAVLLLTGAIRTLRKMSGGLRLLAGAWGVAAGLTLQPATYHAAHQSSYALPLGAFAILILASPFLCLLGLALTVLHKEK